eukprot:scaffold287_cov337-Pavlova_lutheri.AAC.241
MLQSLSLFGVVTNGVPRPCGAFQEVVVAGVRVGLSWRFVSRGLDHHDVPAREFLLEHIQHPVWIHQPLHEFFLRFHSVSREEQHRFFRFSVASPQVHAGEAEGGPALDAVDRHVAPRRLPFQGDAMRRSQSSRPLLERRWWRPSDDMPMDPHWMRWLRAMPGGTVSFPRSGEEGVGRWPCRIPNATREEGRRR